jgi:hypothetical protein
MKLVSKFLLYVGIALLVVTAILAGAAISTEARVTFPVRWVAFAVWTGFLVFGMLKLNLPYLRKRSYWTAAFVFLGLHCLLFAYLLERFSNWRAIWFLPAIALELLFFHVVMAEFWIRAKK